MRNESTGQTDMAKILITGGTGCIGAVTVRKLITEFGSSIEQILIVSRSGSTDQLEIWFGEELGKFIESGKLRFVNLDLGETKALHDTLDEFAPSHLIHLGALQSPACAADPHKGLSINLAGTLSLFEIVAALDRPLERFVFASSGAVYGKRAMYPTATVPENVPLAPPNLYGVWKAAGEHLAALFHEQTGVPTVSLRLNTTYGPGRDQGMTSAPTMVMKRLAIGAHRGEVLPSSMPYQGRENYHYVEDVGHHFAGVCMMPFSGYKALNIKGKTIEVAEFLDAICNVAEKLGIAEYLDTDIAEDAAQNLFICDLEDSAIETHFPGLPRTSITDGIRESLRRFQQLAKVGKIQI